MSEGEEDDFIPMVHMRKCVENRDATIKELRERLAAAEADVAAMREHLKPLMDAPGCAWCGSPAMAYISCGPGEQQGECCPQCMTYFEREDRSFKVLESVALPDMATLRAFLAFDHPGADLLAVVSAARTISKLETLINDLEARQRSAIPFELDGVIQTADDAELGAAYSDLYGAQLELKSALAKLDGGAK